MGGTLDKWVDGLMPPPSRYMVMSACEKGHVEQRRKGEGQPGRGILQPAPLSYGLACSPTWESKIPYGW